MLTVDKMNLCFRREFLLEGFDVSDDEDETVIATEKVPEGVEGLDVVAVQGTEAFIDHEEVGTVGLSDMGDGHTDADAAEEDFQT